MGFIKLPSNSDKILLELAQAENPTQALNAHYEVCSIRERSVLDGIVRELKECGYINVQWADDMPGSLRSTIQQGHTASNSLSTKPQKRYKCSMKRG